MKKFGTTIVMALFLSVLAFAGGEKVQLKVTGMTCGGCAKSVTSAIEKVEGVSSTDVSFETSLATVEFDGEQTNVNDIVKAIKKAGYEADVASEEDIKAAGTSSKSHKACCAGKSKKSCGDKAKSEPKDEQ